MIFQDWSRNKFNFKGKFISLMFRFASLGNKSFLLFLFLFPYLLFYRFFVEWVLGVELPYKTIIGKGLVIYHGHSLVINDNTILGDNCTLRHSTTIGNKELFNGTYSNSPIIGNNVDIGSNVCIIGPINIGNNVKIGAGSVVVKNIPDNVIVAGNPAKIIKYI